MKVGQLVMVSVEGGKPGEVKYVTPAGKIGVALVNEGKVHEWFPTQVRSVSAVEAAQAAKRFLPK